MCNTWVSSGQSFYSTCIVDYNCWTEQPIVAKAEKNSRDKQSVAWGHSCGKSSALRNAKCSPTRQFNVDACWVQARRSCSHGRVRWLTFFFLIAKWSSCCDTRLNLVTRSTSFNWLFGQTVPRIILWCRQNLCRGKSQLSGPCRWSFVRLQLFVAG